MEENINVEISGKVDIESKRLQFKKDYKKVQTIQIIVCSVFMLLMFLSLYILISKPQYILYTFIGIIVLFLGLYLYSRFSRKQKFKIVESFVTEYRNYERKVVYEDIKDLTIKEFDNFGKINEEKIKSKNIFNQIQTIESNNIVSGTYLETKFESSSIIIYKDKTKVIFSGKYYEFDLEKNIDGRIIIELCKENKLDLNYNRLEKYNLQNLEKADIYSDLDKETLTKFFTKKIQKEINDFTIDENVNNVCIIFEGKKLLVFLTTHKKFVDINVNDSFDENIFVLLRNHFKEVASLRKTL